MSRSPRPTPLHLRLATTDDEARVLGWRNEPSTRHASRTTSEISAATHATWYHRVLADPDCLMLIIEAGGNPIGQVRLTRRGPDEAEIHIGLTRRAHGRGLGRRALRIAVGVGRRQFGVSRIVAHVKDSNEQSLRAFVAAGFRECGRVRGVVELCSES